MDLPDVVENIVCDGYLSLVSITGTIKRRKRREKEKEDKI